MVVKTQKVNLGWQRVEYAYSREPVLFSGFSMESDFQARLDWHQVASLPNQGEWEASSMRLLASGLLEVTRKRLLPHLLHPRAQEATSISLYKPFTGKI